MSTITVWVMFVWLGGGLPAAWTYASRADCLADAQTYKHAQCVVMVLPSR